MLAGPIPDRSSSRLFFCRTGSSSQLALAALVGSLPDRSSSRSEAKQLAKQLAPGQKRSEAARARGLGWKFAGQKQLARFLILIDGHALAMRLIGSFG
jgi:hypothetical protein